MADPVTVTYDMKLKPGMGDMMTKVMPGMLDQTQERPGFRSIQIVRKDGDPDRVLLIEQWDSEADYRAYLAWRAERGESSDAIFREPCAPEIWSLPIIER